MEPRQLNENDLVLDQLLLQWRVETPLPPRFEEQVWRRLARAEATGEPDLWGTLRRWVETVLPRPAVAVAYLSLLLLLGVSSGFWQARHQTRHLEADLGSRYVQSLDPFLAIAHAQ